MPAGDVFYGQFVVKCKTGEDIERCRYGYTFEIHLCLSRIFVLVNSFRQLVGCQKSDLAEGTVQLYAGNVLVCGQVHFLYMAVCVDGLGSQIFKSCSFLV